MTACHFIHITSHNNLLQLKYNGVFKHLDLTVCRKQIGVLGQ